MTIADGATVPPAPDGYFFQIEKQRVTRDMPNEDGTYIGTQPLTWVQWKTLTSPDSEYYI